MAASRASIVDHVRAMLEFQATGAEVFDNGNLIRTQAREGGVANAFDIRSSPKPICARCSPAPSAPSAGWRCRARRAISPASTTWCWRCFPTTRSSPTGSGWRAKTCRSRGCPPASPGSAMASARRWRGGQRAGRLRRAQGADRLFPRSSRCRRHGASQHHDRADEGRLGRHRRLAAARCDAALLVDGRSRRRPFRRRRLCRLYDQLRRDAGGTERPMAPRLGDERLESTR
jgi:hypothetical protein